MIAPEEYRGNDYGEDDARCWVCSGTIAEHMEDVCGDCEEHVDGMSKEEFYQREFEERS